MRLRCGPNLPHRTGLESSRKVRHVRKVLVNAKVGRALRASRPTPRINCQNMVRKSCTLPGARTARPPIPRPWTERVETPIGPSPPLTLRDFSPCRTCRSCRLHREGRQISRVSVKTIEFWGGRRGAARTGGGEMAMPKTTSISCQT